MLNIENGINLVKFAATWCAPCKVIAKTVKKVLPDFPSVVLNDIDVDDFPKLAKEYKIRSVPTVIVFRNGNEITREVGNLNESRLREMLQQVISEEIVV